MARAPDDIVLLSAPDTHRHSAPVLLALGATVVWIILFGARFAGLEDVPGASFVLIGVPVCVLAYALVPQHRAPAVAGAAGAIVLVVVAAAVAPIIVASPVIAVAPLGLLIGALACTRFPASATLAVFFLSGTYGSLEAFTGLPGALLIDVLLGGLWVGVILSRITGSDRLDLPIWPAIAAFGAYAAVTLFQVLAGDNLNTGFLSFRLSTWYMLALLLIAYAGWDRAVYTRIVKGAIAIIGLVAAYATLRWFIGPAGVERDFAIQVGGAYNFVGGDLRVVGSFSSGHQLGFWTAAMAPFALAATFGFTGRWQLIAGATFVLVVFAVLASEVRGAMVGLVLGLGMVLVLSQLTRSSPGLGLGRTIVVGSLAVAILAGSLLFTSGAEDRLERYTNILSPGDDPAYVVRQEKWSEAVADLDEHPFGRGVGSASLNPALRSPFLSVASNSLDSSYLKIAFEQGLAVMIFFALVLIGLTLTLAIASVRSRDRLAGPVGIGAAGALTSTIVLLYSGIYIEDVITLSVWLVAGLGIALLVREQAESRRSAIAERSDALDEAGQPPSGRGELPAAAQQPS